MAKRPPILADRILHNPAMVGFSKRWIAQRVHDIRTAHRFVLTDDAAITLAKTVLAYPELLDINGKFAIPPFPTMWVELPIRPYMGVMNVDIAPAYVENTVGYLFVDGAVYVFSGDLHSAGEAMAVMPLRYELNRSTPIEAQQEMAAFLGISRGQLDRFYWGQSLYDSIPRTSQTALRRDHGARLIPETEDYLKLPNAGVDLNIGAAGDLRNIVALLLALNQPAKYILKEGLPTIRQMTKRGPKPFMAHSTIEFSLSRAPKRVLFRPSRRPRPRDAVRWHEVRGHFCTNRKARNSDCDHGGGEWWVETDEHKWECLGCGGKRWWREYPEGRGTAKVGFVTSEHEVVP